MRARRLWAAATPSSSRASAHSRAASVIEATASGSRLTMYCWRLSRSSSAARSGSGSPPGWARASSRKATASRCDPAWAASAAARSACARVRSWSPAAWAWWASTAGSAPDAPPGPRAPARAAGPATPAGWSPRRPGGPARGGSRRPGGSGSAGRWPRACAAAGRRWPRAGRRRSSSESGAVAMTWSASRSAPPTRAGAGEHGVADRGGQRLRGVPGDLGDEERVAAGQRQDRRGVDPGAVQDGPDGVDGQALERDRAGGVEPGDVAEQRPQRVVAARSRRRGR